MAFWWLHPFRVEAQIRTTWTKRIGSERAGRLAAAQRNAALATCMTIVITPLMIIAGVVVSIAAGSPQAGLDWMLVGLVILLIALGWQRFSIWQRHSSIGAAVTAMRQHDSSLTEADGRILFRSPTSFDVWSGRHPGVFNES